MITTSEDQHPAAGEADQRAANAAGSVQRYQLHSRTYLTEVLNSVLNDDAWPHPLPEIGEAIEWLAVMRHNAQRYGWACDYWLVPV